MSEPITELPDDMKAFVVEYKALCDKHQMLIVSDCEEIMVSRSDDPADHQQGVNPYWGVEESTLRWQNTYGEHGAHWGHQRPRPIPEKRFDILMFRDGEIIYCHEIEPGLSEEEGGAIIEYSKLGTAPSWGVSYRKAHAGIKGAPGEVYLSAHVAAADEAAAIAKVNAKREQLIADNLWPVDEHAAYLCNKEQDSNV